MYIMSWRILFYAPPILDDRTFKYSLSLSTIPRIRSLMHHIAPNASNLSTTEKITLKSFYYPSFQGYALKYFDKK